MLAILNQFQKSLNHSPWAQKDTRYYRRLKCSQRKCSPCPCQCLFTVGDRGKPVVFSDLKMSCAVLCFHRMPTCTEHIAA